MVRIEDVQVGHVLQLEQLPELLLLLLAPKEAPSKGLAEAQEVRMASEAKSLGANIWERIYKAVECRRSVKTREPEVAGQKQLAFIRLLHEKET